MSKRHWRWHQGQWQCKGQLSTAAGSCLGRVCMSSSSPSQLSHPPHLGQIVRHEQATRDGQQVHQGVEDAGLFGLAGVGEGHVHHIRVFAHLQGVLKDTEEASLVWGRLMCVCVCVCMCVEGEWVEEGFVLKECG